jgi:hypothetical protein
MEKNPEQASAEEIKRNRRKCFTPSCKHKAFLRDWGGWEWCFRCWWKEINNGEHSKWLYFKTTKIF